MCDSLSSLKYEGQHLLKSFITSQSKMFAWMEFSRLWVRCVLDSDKGLNNSRWHLEPSYRTVLSLLFFLHFSHVLSYVISLELDKTPGEGFCSWGHRPGSVSGLQLLIIRSYKRLGACMAWGTPYRIPFTPRLTSVNCTSSLPLLFAYLTLTSSKKTLWYYISPKL